MDEGDETSFALDVARDVRARLRRGKFTYGSCRAKRWTGRPRSGRSSSHSWKINSCTVRKKKLEDLCESLSWKHSHRETTATRPLPEDLDAEADDEEAVDI